MEVLKNYRIAIAIFVLSLMFGLLIGFSLPEDAQVPIHWNVEGEVDNFVNRTWGIIMFPLIMLFLLVFFILFPHLSPRYEKETEKFDKILPMFANILIISFACIYLLSLLVAKGTEFDGTEMIWVIIGIMFLLIGRLLPKLPSSFFLGIRTPWTLSSEQVWVKTHQVGGWTFSIGGVLFLMGGMVKQYAGISSVIFYVLISLLVVFPIIYSFVIYQRESGKNNE